MSVGRPNTGIVLTPEQYHNNQAKLERVQAVIDEQKMLNEQGYRNHIQLAAELEAKVREGDEARRQLEELKNAARNPQILTRLLPTQKQIAPPPNYNTQVPSASSSRIEEVPDYNDQANPYGHTVNGNRGYNSTSSYVQQPPHASHRFQDTTPRNQIPTPQMNMAQNTAAQQRQRAPQQPMAQQYRRYQTSPPLQQQVHSAPQGGRSSVLGSVNYQQQHQQPAAANQSGSRMHVAYDQQMEQEHMRGTSLQAQMGTQQNAGYLNSPAFQDQPATQNTVPEHITTINTPTRNVAVGNTVTGKIPYHPSYNRPQRIGAGSSSLAGALATISSNGETSKTKIQEISGLSSKMSTTPLATDNNIFTNATPHGTLSSTAPVKPPVPGESSSSSSVKINTSLAVSTAPAQSTASTSVIPVRNAEPSYQLLNAMITGSMSVSDREQACSSMKTYKVLSNAELKRIGDGVKKIPINAGFKIDGTPYIAHKNKDAQPYIVWSNGKGRAFFMMTGEFFAAQQKLQDAQVPPNQASVQEHSAPQQQQQQQPQSTKVPQNQASLQGNSEAQGKLQTTQVSRNQASVQETSVLQSTTNHAREAQPVASASTSGSTFLAPAKKPGSLRSPAEVDKTHLARDILRALHRSSGQKRQRDADPASASLPERDPKWHAYENNVLGATSANLEANKSTTPAKSSSASTYTAINTPAVPTPTSSAHPSHPPANTMSAFKLSDTGNGNATNGQIVPPPATVGTVNAPSVPVYSFSTFPVATTITSYDSNIPKDAPIVPAYRYPSASSVTTFIPYEGASKPRTNNYYRIAPVAASQSSTAISQQDNRKPPVPSSAPTASPVVGPPPLNNVQETSHPEKNTPAKPVDNTAALVTASPTSIPASPVVSSSHYRQRTPLFLPSPSSSPSRGHETASPQRVEELPNKKSIEKQPFYILVPPLPDYVKRYKAQEANRQEVPSRKSRFRVEGRKSPSQTALRSKSLSSSRAKSQSLSLAQSVGRSKKGDIDFCWEVLSNFGYNEAEREAVRISCTRVQELPCKWDGCPVVMNSVESMIEHLNLHHKPPHKDKPFHCMWHQCGSLCSNTGPSFGHVEKKHALNPLRCAYEGCDETFRIAGSLVKHNEAEHKDTPLKPAYKPFPPPPRPLPPYPAVLESYKVVSRQVNRAPISRERHQAVGPWVLRNISGPVHLNTERYNAAMPLKVSRYGVNEGEEGSDNYEFLISGASSKQYFSTLSSPAKLRGELAEIPSRTVSEMVSNGFTLWGDTAMAEKPHPRTPSPLDSLFGSPGGRVKTEDFDRDLERDVSPTPRADDGDEEAVENMLTLAESS